MTNPPKPTRAPQAFNPHTRSMILAALFAALTAAGALVKVPIGPAPITLQLFFTLLSGLLLGPYWGALSQLLYIFIGLAGLPVFSAGGGLNYVFHPTFGYIIGFALSPLLIGALAGRREVSFPRLLLSCFAGVVLVYAVGVPYLYATLRYVNGTPITFSRALMTGCLVFLPGDIGKCLLAAWLGRRLLPILRPQSRS